MCKVDGLGMGWDGIYCGYGVATALRFVHWSTPFLTKKKVPKMDFFIKHIFEV